MKEIEILRNKNPAVELLPMRTIMKSNEIIQMINSKRKKTEEGRFRMERKEKIFRNRRLARRTARERKIRM